MSRFVYLKRNAYAHLRVVRTALYLFAFTPALAWADSYGVTNPLGKDATFCSLAEKIISATLQIGAPIAVLLIVLTGFGFVAARGNPEKLKKARENFTYTLAGIAVFFCAWAITKVVIGTASAFGADTSGCNV